MMIYTAPSNERFQRQMRRLICTRCTSRPLHSETLGSEVVRPCELTCPLFRCLPLLRKTAMLRDPMLGSRRQALRQQIQQLSNGNGDSPLSRHRDDVIRGILDLLRDS